MREFESSSSGSVVTTTRGFCITEVVATSSPPVVECGALAVQPASAIVRSAKVLGQRELPLILFSAF
jgi:hypothetical protein